MPPNQGATSGTDGFTKADDGDFLGQSDVANDKHLLIKVPDFGMGTFERRGDATHPTGQTTTESLSSFLRLGKFDMADETLRSKELLAVIHRAGGPGDPRLPESSAWPADTVWEPGDGAWNTEAPPFDTSITERGNNDVFFLDDVRTHDVDLDVSILTKQDTFNVRGHGLTKAQRQRESQQLFARGGWRDHSDGNRISTTYGDKVEVVRGNYKMIVMGRQDDPGEGMGWDVAGDHVVDYAPGTMPGAGFWLEFVPDYVHTTVGEPPGENKRNTGVWLLVNTTEGVYEYARYAGNFREERWGDVLETYTGSSNPPGEGRKLAKDATEGSGGHDPPAGSKQSDRSYDLPKYGPTTAAGPLGTQSDRLVPEWQHDNQDVIRSNPHIIDRTWAVRIDSTTGSGDCPVTHGIFESTWAKRIESNTGSSDAWIEEAIVEKTYAKDIESTTYAKTTKELVDVAVRIESNTRAGSIFEATTAGTIFDSTTAALHVSLAVGAVIDVFLGLKLEVQVAGAISISTSTLELEISKTGIAVNDVEAKLNKAVTALQDTDTVLQAQVICLQKATTALIKNDTALATKCTALSVSLGA